MAVKYFCSSLEPQPKPKKEPKQDRRSPKDQALTRMYNGIDILCRILAGCAVLLTIKEFFNGI
jgi:hypothetical protein